MTTREEHDKDFKRFVNFLNLAGLVRVDETTLQITDKFICLLVKNGYADIHRDNSGYEYMKEIVMKAVYEGLEAPKDMATWVGCYNIMKSLLIINLRSEPDPRAQKILELLESEA